MTCLTKVSGPSVTSGHKCESASAVGLAAERQNVHVLSSLEGRHRRRRLGKGRAPGRRTMLLASPAPRTTR